MNHNLQHQENREDYQSAHSTVRQGHPLEKLLMRSCDSSLLSNARYNISLNRYPKLLEYCVEYNRVLFFAGLAFLLSSFIII